MMLTSETIDFFLFCVKTETIKIFLYKMRFEKTKLVD